MKTWKIPMAFVITMVGISLTATSLWSQNIFEAKEGQRWGTKVQEAIDALDLVGDPVEGEDIFGVCAACHRPTGWGDPAGTFPQLAGQHTSVLIKQIADIRAGNRDNPTMYPFAIQIEGAQNHVEDVKVDNVKINGHLVDDTLKPVPNQ